MWCLETIIKLNKVAHQLAIRGLPEKDAFPMVGIDAPPRAPKDVVEERVTSNGSYYSTR